MLVSKRGNVLVGLQILYSLGAIQIVLFAFHVRRYALFFCQETECFLSQPYFLLDDIPLKLMNLV